MSQVFSPAADTSLRLLGCLVLAVILLFFPVRSMIEHASYSTGVGLFVPQPVPFSHEHHVGRVGLHCLYCHTSVERSSFAGLPSTETCMGCHAHIWKDAELLAPVRMSYATNTPIAWRRVNKLPDFTYFDHSIHAAKGIGCESCHGRVDKMPLTKKARPFFMSECVDCHRNPERYLRPKDKIFEMGWQVDADTQARMGAELAAEYKVRRLTDCTTCHR